MKISHYLDFIEHGMIGWTSCSNPAETMRGDTHTPPPTPSLSPSCLHHLPPVFSTQFVLNREDQKILISDICF